MPQSSRYSDEHVEKLLAELVSVLEKPDTDRPFSYGVRKYGDQSHQYQCCAVTTRSYC